MTMIKNPDKFKANNSNKDKKDPFFSETNLTHIKQSVKQLREGKGTSHELIKVK